MLLNNKIIIPYNICVPIPRNPINLSKFSIQKFLNSIPFNSETSNSALNKDQSINSKGFALIKGKPVEQRLEFFDHTSAASEQSEDNFSELRDPSIEEHNVAELNSQIKKRITKLIKNIQKYKRSIKLKRKLIKKQSSVTIIKNFKKRNQKTKEKYDRYFTFLELNLDNIFKKISSSVKQEN